MLPKAGVHSFRNVTERAASFVWFEVRDLPDSQRFSSCRIDISPESSGICLFIKTQEAFLLFGGKDSGREQPLVRGARIVMPAVNPCR